MCKGKIEDKFINHIVDDELRESYYFDYARAFPKYKWLN